MHLSDYLNIQPLINFFHTYPYSVGIFTFFIVFAETMAVIGAIFPGAIIMPAIGFLIGSNVVPFGSTMLCAITGAITGDYVSYFIGIYFQNRIHHIWPFTRWPKLLAQGEKYFHAHGGKSVFIGRFVMLIRVIIPLIAGMLKMPFWRFSIAAIPSATLWAIGYIIPGILLGALSLELPPKMAAEFTLWSFVLSIGLWVLVWLIHHFFKRIWQLFDYTIVRIWHYFHNHKSLCWLTEILADPRKPNNHQQLTLAIAVVVTFSLFLFTTYQVATNGVITKIDDPIYYLLRSLRAPTVDYIAILITLLGEGLVLAIASGLFFIWLIWKRYWYIAAHWFGVMLLCVGMVSETKLFIYLPRPGEILYERFTSSFPSAHTALSLAFYGFLAVIIARESKKQNRSLPYIISGILVALISLSRLYLGAHWLTDIIGSLLLGLSIVLLVTISYRRRHHLHFAARQISLAAISIFITVWLGYSYLTFSSKVQQYTLIWPHPIVTYNQLPKVAPLYRTNRMGDAIEALNLEWVGAIDKIKQQLLKQGWKTQQVKFDYLNVVKGFFNQEAIYHMPIFPQLYHNHLPVLLLTKETGQDEIILVLYLWPSDITLTDVDLPLWIGSVKYYHPNTKKFFLNHFKPPFMGATKIFTEYLAGFNWQQKEYSQKQQPEEMASLHWDGKMLMVKP